MSNRDSEKNEDKADPLEIVLYAVFVATSARASVGELADILQVIKLVTPTFPCKLADGTFHFTVASLDVSQRVQQDLGAASASLKLKRQVLGKLAHLISSSQMSRGIAAERWDRSASIVPGKLTSGVGLVQVELPKLQAAISIACRLGFAKRLPNPNEGVPSHLSMQLTLHLFPFLSHRVGD